MAGARRGGTSRGKGKGRASAPVQAESYEHSQQAVLRPDVGTQAQFRKKRPPKTWRYDSSLAPELQWDGGNPTREHAEWLLAAIEKAARLDPPHVFPAPIQRKDQHGRIAASVQGLTDAVDQLRRLGRPFLNWAGKAERQSFDVPILPLFVHERLSTKAILETLKGHERDRQESMFSLFADPELSIRDQVLRAYEHQGQWVNRMILGDSLVVMSSLLEYEGLGGQVQTIYVDPPYGVQFGSNFQPFVRKRDVKHGDDDDMTREPEMVKAYRDTWELGLHSYLTYLRDRLLVARELLTPSGSVFVQISQDNVHHVREVMDEVFGGENAIGMIVVQKTGGLGTSGLKAVADYLLWHARDAKQAKYRQLFKPKVVGIGEGTGARYDQLMSPNGTDYRGLTTEEREDPTRIPSDWRAFQFTSLTSGAFREKTTVPFELDGETFHPGSNACWKTTVEGLGRLVKAGRIRKAGQTIRYVRFIDDFPAHELTNVWDDVAGAADKLYVVQTSPTVVSRCLLMTTDPGDLVLDPTCGSGTTAYVAEKWGRRWITIDTSRVPLALARQRVLTATFPYYELNDEKRGPAGGFRYQRRQNAKGEEVGGIVPHVTLKSIANDEPPKEEVLVDRPEVVSKVTRVSGPFTVEATIPTPVDWDSDGVEDSGADPQLLSSYVDRMLEILRRSPVLHLGGGRTIELRNIRPPAKTLSLSAEAATLDTATGGGAAGGEPTGSGQAVAIVFGPENGSVSEKLVYEAAREAHAKRFAHLYVIGFAIQENAQRLVDSCDEVVGVGATYIAATPDLMMGDLLKNMRSSQIFSVCGRPDVAVRRVKRRGKAAPAQWQVEVRGLDTFDPVSMESSELGGGDLPAWLLDTDYNGLCFHVCQAFFPRTAAWDDIKRSLKGQYDDAVWAHLAGTISAPFEAGQHGKVAVKVIDDRGNELMVVKDLAEAEP
jgi:adenine-specific DNA-methyltransferase